MKKIFKILIASGSVLLVAALVCVFTFLYQYSSNKVMQIDSYVEKEEYIKAGDLLNDLYLTQTSDISLMQYVFDKYMEIGDTANAAAVLDTLYAQKSADHEFLYELYGKYKQLGKTEKRIEILQKLKQDAQYRSFAYKELSLIYEDTKKPWELYQFYQEAYKNTKEERYQKKLKTLQTSILPETKEGSYDAVTTVSFSEKSLDKIQALYYTLDGSSPTRESAVYEKPITLPIGTTVLKYFTVNKNNIQSDVMTMQYTTTRTTASKKSKEKAEELLRYISLYAITSQPDISLVHRAYFSSYYAFCNSEADKEERVEQSYKKEYSEELGDHANYMLFFTLDELNRAKRTLFGNIYPDFTASSFQSVSNALKGDGQEISDDFYYSKEENGVYFVFADAEQYFPSCTYIADGYETQESYVFTIYDFWSDPLSETIQQTPPSTQYGDASPEEYQKDLFPVEEAFFDNSDFDYRQQYLRQLIEEGTIRGDVYRITFRKGNGKEFYLGAWERIQ